MDEKNMKLEELKTKLQDAYNDADMLNMLSLPLPREKVEEIKSLEHEYSKEAMGKIVEEIQQQIQKFISSFSVDFTYSHEEKRIIWSPSVNSQEKNIRQRHNNVPHHNIESSKSAPALNPVAAPIASGHTEKSTSSKIMVRLKSRRIRAFGTYDGVTFIVQKGSQADVYCSKIFTGYEKRDRMLKSYAKRNNDVWTLLFDMEFSSPSAASVFCLGRSSNGWLEWADENGRTLKDVFANQSGNQNTDYRTSSSNVTKSQLGTYGRDVYEQSGKAYIRVVFPDNRVSCNRQVWQTLVDVVNYAGGKNVQRLGIMHLGDNLVSSQLHPNSAYRSAQKMLDNGLYVSTFSTTEVKYKQIQQINRELKLSLVVQKILS